MQSVQQLHDRLLSLALNARELSLSELSALCADVAPATHLAVMRQPFLDCVVDGRKTIESRLTRNRVAPFGLVAPGDAIVFKLAGGPLRGAAVVDAVRSIGPVQWPVLAAAVREMYSELMMTDDWLELKQGSHYGSFLRLATPIKLPSVTIAKTDRRPWVTLVDRRVSRSLPGSLSWV